REPGNQGTREPGNQGTREPGNQWRLTDQVEGSSGPDKTPGDACWFRAGIVPTRFPVPRFEGSVVFWFPGSMVPQCPLVPSLCPKELVRIPPRVVTAQRHELLMSPLLDHTPVLDDKDYVGRQDCREAVRDCEHRSALRDSFQRLLDRPLRHAVDARSRF